LAFTGFFFAPFFTIFLKLNAAKKNKKTRSGDLMFFEETMIQKKKKDNLTFFSHQVG